MSSGATPAATRQQAAAPNIDLGDEIEGPLLSTIDIASAHTLATPPELPRKEVETGDTLWPRSPAKEMKLEGRSSVYDFLAGSTFK